MTIEVLTFTLSDQRAFAALSRDYNPLHLDAVAARRRLPGEPVVHGMHLLLRALNVYFRRRAGSAACSISARFYQPALLGDRIRVSASGGLLTLALDGGLALADIRFSSRRQSAGDASTFARQRIRQSTRPRVVAFEGVMGASGTIALPGVAAARRAFPHAAKALGAHAVVALAGLSRVVGMECPGRDSLLSAVEVVVTRGAASNRLSWRVGKADPRFKLLRLQVGNECLSGTVDAFLTQPPSEIPMFEGVAAQVDPTEFAGQRALIVGGSRGLGAATALIVASGGGVPLVTFASGSAEVALLRREARRAGRRIDALRFDVITDSTDRLRRVSRRFGVTHLYYFATPRIFARRREPFDAMLFERFAAFYVKGFADACAAAGASALTMFYPSSTSVDEPVRELTEYAAAKAAGEVLCRQLAATTPGLRVLVHRLGRIATDQTASVVAAPAIDPVAAMLPIVRDMHRVARDGR